MIKAIIFDCWNTLFFCSNNCVSVFAEKLGKTRDDYEFMKLLEKHVMLEKHYKLEVPIRNLLKELGIPFSDSFVKELDGILDKGLDFLKAYPETLHVLSELKHKFKLGLITNTDYLGFVKLEELFHLNRFFNVILKSYEIKLLKPDPKIFEIMLNKLQVEKHEVLMIGDSLKADVEAAGKFGMKAVLIDRKNKHPDYPNRITSLDQLKNFIEF